MIISKEFRFEASHVLPKHPGKCRNLHGHSWKLTVSIEGLVNPETGFVVDYADLKALVHEAIINKVDHAHLGQNALHAVVPDWVGIPVTKRLYPAVYGDDFYPSSENLVSLFAIILRPAIRAIPAAVATNLFPRLYRVKLDETCTSECIWQTGRGWMEED